MKEFTYTLLFVWMLFSGAFILWYVIKGFDMATDQRKPSDYFYALILSLAVGFVLSIVVSLFGLILPTDKDPNDCPNYHYYSDC